MLRIDSIKLPPEAGMAELAAEAARLLRVDRSTAFRRLCRAKENLRRFAGGCLAVTAPEKPLSAPEKHLSGTEKPFSGTEKQLSGTESGCHFPADRVY